MKVRAFRRASKLLLVAAMVIAIVALVLFEKLTLPVILVFLAAAIVCVVLAVIFNVNFWCCPSCGKRFGTYDVQTEASGVCPYCNERFAEPKVPKTKN